MTFGTFFAIKLTLIKLFCEIPNLFLEDAVARSVAHQNLLADAVARCVAHQDLLDNAYARSIADQDLRTNAIARYVAHQELQTEALPQPKPQCHCQTRGTDTRYSPRAPTHTRNCARAVV